MGGRLGPADARSGARSAAPSVRDTGNLRPGSAGRWPSVLLAACRSGCRGGGAAEAGRGVGEGHSERGCGPSALASYLCELGRVAQHRRVLFNPGKSLVK